MKRLALLSALLLAACVSDEKAVNMGLATACDGKGTVASLGDPANRYVTVDGGESCKGPKRNTYDTRTLAVLDCGAAPARLDVKVSQLAVDTTKHGANYDWSQAVATQKTRLRLGLTDLAGAQAALTAAGVPATLTPGTAGEECIKRNG